MKILVVEDEVKAAHFLQKGLEESGFVVDIVFDGEAALKCAMAGTYDLLIIDVMIPKFDGWTLIDKLRKAGCQTLALFLTARDSLDDRVRGLDAGADAYMVKPFSFSELLAQVKSLLRRSTNRITDQIKIADLEIDLLRRVASRGGKKLVLTPKEFSLLSLLVRKQGEVLSRTVIADQVWNINFDSETNVVDVHVARLRVKVDSEHSKKLIHTVRGVGYVLRDETQE